MEEFNNTAMSECDLNGSSTIQASTHNLGKFTLENNTQEQWDSVLESMSKKLMRELSDEGYESIVNIIPNTNLNDYCYEAENGLHLHMYFDSENVSDIWDTGMVYIVSCSFAFPEGIPYLK
ncbi:MAG: hypothetical protein Unbinned8472contig1000_76 [Prokaryotic dsDNA virus sp.]|nr:MAG: hypothetical protein Unbinned8472contig1000_76 [Prokaryotic dsDNA virus sp.]|tara:strand:+ start:39297 stop:39659 length:363 start_codon:yes stop_codon:yes gene_type:complete